MYFNFYTICYIYYDNVKLETLYVPAVDDSTNTRNSTSISLENLPRDMARPFSWACRIHGLLLCRGVRLPPTSLLDMTLNNLMVRLQ